MTKSKPVRTVARKPIPASEWRRLHLPGTPGKITGDPEVAAFIDEEITTKSFRLIVEACKERFGPARAPGRSAVHRYWMTYHAPRVRGR